MLVAIVAFVLTVSAGDPNAPGLRGALWLIGFAAVGSLVGRSTRQTVQPWFVVALSAVGMALLEIGLSYDEFDGSGAFVAPFTGAGNVVLAVAALAAGISVGRAVRSVGARALASRFRSGLGPLLSVALKPPVIVGFLVFVGLANTSMAFIGFHDEFVRYTLLGAALVGTVTGAATGLRVPDWALVALPLVAVALVVAGASQYNDDGDSGALLGLLLRLGWVAFLVAALAGGAAIGAALRGPRRAVARD